MEGFFYPNSRPVMADLILDSNFDAFSEYYTKHSRPSDVARGAWGKKIAGIASDLLQSKTNSPFLY